MGEQIEKSETERKIENRTKPHLKQFFDIKSMGPEPPLNKDGFWPKPGHGVKTLKNERGQKKKNKGRPA